jgi:hypothetical protein
MVRDLVTGLPSTMDHQNNQMLVGPDGWIHFGQGTATNSGIVGLDNAIPFPLLTMWPHLHEIPAKEIVLTGKTVLAPHVNNVAAKQGQLVSLGPMMGQISRQHGRAGASWLAARAHGCVPAIWRVWRSGDRRVREPH